MLRIYGFGIIFNIVPLQFLFDQSMACRKASFKPKLSQRVIAFGSRKRRSIAVLGSTPEIQQAKSCPSPAPNQKTLNLNPGCIHPNPELLRLSAGFIGHERNFQPLLDMSCRHQESTGFYKPSSWWLAGKRIPI